MLDAQQIKQKALSLGATTCGIGDIGLLRNEAPENNPFYILPKAKSLIGFGLRVPRALYKAMDSKSQFYTYTTLGVKYIDETFAEIFLLKMGALIENEGYDACLQRSVPCFKVKGDHSTNPEVKGVYSLESASPVEEGKPAPDVIINFGKAAQVCGLGSVGLHGRIISPQYGTFMRYVFIITDLPLEPDKPFTETLCDKCGECVRACPGRAIGEDGLDTWQCSVYYRGAHKSNPLITEDFLKGHPERDAILNGEKRFTRDSAEAVYGALKFLPDTHFGYVACLCGKPCEIACQKHLGGQKP